MGTKVSIYLEVAKAGLTYYDSTIWRLFMSIAWIVYNQKAEALESYIFCHQYLFINLNNKGSSIVQCPAKRNMWCRICAPAHYFMIWLVMLITRNRNIFHLICLDLNYYVMCPSFLSSYLGNGGFAHSLRLFPSLS